MNCRVSAVIAITLLTVVTAARSFAVPILIDSSGGSAGHFDEYYFHYTGSGPGWSADLVGGDFMDGWGFLRAYRADGRTGNAMVTLDVHAEIRVALNGIIWVTPEEAANFGGMNTATAHSMVSIGEWPVTWASRSFGGTVMPDPYSTDFSLKFPVQLGVETPFLLSVNHIGIAPVGLHVIDPSAPAGFGISGYATATITRISATAIPEAASTCSLLLVGLFAWGLAGRLGMRRAVG